MEEEKSRYVEDELASGGVRLYYHFMKVFLLAPLFLAGWLLCATSALGCPTCKDSFTKEDSANGTKIVSKGLNSTGLGFGWSVLFMLAAPASVATGLVWLVVKNGRDPSEDSTS